jgi:hypothetical protein
MPGTWLTAALQMLGQPARFKARRCVRCWATAASMPALTQVSARPSACRLRHAVSRPCAQASISAQGWPIVHAAWHAPAIHPLSYQLGRCACCRISSCLWKISPQGRVSSECTHSGRGPQAAAWWRACRPQEPTVLQPHPGQWRPEPADEGDAVLLKEC